MIMTALSLLLSLLTLSLLQCDALSFYSLPPPSSSTTSALSSPLSSTPKLSTTLPSNIYNDATPSITKSNNNAITDASRRRFFLTAAVSSILIPSLAANVDSLDYMLTSAAVLHQQRNHIVAQVPIHWMPNLNAYVVYFYIGDEKYGGILDTGSPFVMIPDSCTEKWGCRQKSSQRNMLIDVGLENTVERFNYGDGLVKWRQAPISFTAEKSSTTVTGKSSKLLSKSRAQSTYASATHIATSTSSELDVDKKSATSAPSSADTTPTSNNKKSNNTPISASKSKNYKNNSDEAWPNSFTLGIAGDSLLKGPGGIFFGLIRDTDDWIRPSFLSQTKNVRSFVIDLATPSHESLTLYSALPRYIAASKQVYNKAIALVTDLKTTFNFPVLHYTAKADSLIINGRPFANPENWPIYVIFDTGVSGMVVTTELYDYQYQTARKNRDKKLWGTVDIGMQNIQGQVQSISARNPITTLQAMFWPKGTQPAHVIVMGLSFLVGHRMTVDMDGQKVWIE